MLTRLSRYSTILHPFIPHYHHNTTIASAALNDGEIVDLLITELREIVNQETWDNLFCFLIPSRRAELVDLVCCLSRDKSFCVSHVTYLVTCHLPDHVVTLDFFQDTTTMMRCCSSPRPDSVATSSPRKLP